MHRRDAVDLTVYAGRQGVLRRFAEKYGDENPDPYAIYGYEAMKLGLDAIERARRQGQRRTTSLEALFATKDRDSVLGTYSIDENGDTTLTDYGVYKVGDDGEPDVRRDRQGAS